MVKNTATRLGSIAPPVLDPFSASGADPAARKKGQLRLREIFERQWAAFEQMLDRPLARVRLLFRAEEIAFVALGSAVGAVAGRSLYYSIEGGATVRADGGNGVIVANGSGPAGPL